MTFTELKSTVESRYASLVSGVEVHELQKEAVVTTDPSRWVELVRRLKETEGLLFDHLSSLTALDEPAKGRIVVVAHLWSYPLRHAITLKTPTPREDPRLDTLCGLYRSADWMEREVFDLFGVTFTGHPDLRRIMMPDDYTKFPLRKDFTDAGFVPKPN